MRFFLLTLIASLSLGILYKEAPGEICLTNNAYEDRYATWSPDGQWIAFHSDRDGDREIYMMDYMGENVRQLTQNDVDDIRPTWRSDGESLLFESTRDGQQGLYEVRIDQPGVRLYATSKEGELMFADCAKNGSVAASLKLSDSTSHIVLLDQEGKVVRKLVENEYRNHYPRWSPDGKEILYFSRKETNNTDDEVYRLNVENGDEQRLTTWPTHNFCPSWSPDGENLVYVTSMEDVRPEIFIMESRGGTPVRLTYNEDGETLPDWHPTENKILITAYRAGDFEICVLNWE
jgi:TolB protein